MSAIAEPVTTQPTTYIQPTPGQIIAKYQASAPVDVLSLARELGLNVWSMNSLPSNISGKIFRDPLNGGRSGFSIAVNGNDGRLRQRFTVAHEIGHFILHRSRLESGDLVDDAMYRSGLSTKEEQAANRLAADILMPHALIRALVASGMRDVQTLATKLQVSLPAMKIRLGIPVA
jgi:hypothetical protein